MHNLQDAGDQIPAVRFAVVVGLEMRSASALFFKGLDQTKKTPVRCLAFISQLLPSQVGGIGGVWVELVVIDIISILKLLPQAVETWILWTVYGNVPGLP